MSNSNYAETRYNDNFTANYLKFSKTITRFMKKMVLDWDISEELSHDVFLKIFERNIDLDPQSPRTMSYLFTVAKNTAIDYLRRKKIEEAKLQEVYFEEISIDKDFCDSVGEAYLRGEIVSTLSDIIDSFSEKNRDIFIKKNYHKKKYSSIAYEAQVSTYRIKQIDEELNQKIRNGLKQYFEEYSV
jgi:RNA polymerase sigma factor (sigma-70 family)